MISIENRKFERYVITFPVEFFWKSSPGKVVAGQVINISLGGVQIFVKGTLEERYDRILTTLFLPNKEIIRQVEAQLVYFKLAFEGVLIGLMLLNMSPDKYGLFKSFIQSLGNK
ncbi:MAG: PilZ domain-containing protein [Elusimicrobia bacterium]|nr:PilZ domain-containing protein [Elusimicrobiota bacterium]